MKILLISTFGKAGGAGIASWRLKNALIKHGMEVSTGVLFSNGNDNFLLAGNSVIQRWWAKLLFSIERLKVWSIISKKKYLYKYSIGKVGLNITKHPAVMNADVIHIHWANFSLLSIKGIHTLSLQKPLVWTLHDMWAFTGGCHYSLDCDYYRSECFPCFYLRGQSKASLNLQKHKEKEWARSKFCLITCSSWLKECAEKSTLFNKTDISVIGNTLNFKTFCPKSKTELRERHKLPLGKFYILFGSVDHADERKGFQYLLEAFKIASQKVDNLCLLTFGKPLDGIESISLGVIKNETSMAEVYNLADIFILPSLQDNLPNTVLESMACEVPVVAFDCGGVNDMITHKENGFLAENKNSNQLAEGINYFLDHKIRDIAAINARKTIVDRFSETKIAEEHQVLYQRLIERRND